MTSVSSLRLVGSGGANRAMEAELKRLAKRALDNWSDPKPLREDEQTLVYPFEPELAWMASSYLRTPSRVLWDVCETESRMLEPLYDEVMDWMVDAGEGWLSSGVGISIRARDVEWFPASRTQIQGTIKNAIIDGAAQRGVKVHLEPEAPDVLLAVRGTKDRLVISIDLGGNMSAHGAALDRGAAPLRENVAAQILMLSRWNPREEVLIDPMCGSATIAIEAALMARGEALPDAPLAAKLPIFASHAGREDLPLFADAEPIIFANDIDPAATSAAKRNIARAKAGDRIALIEGDFRRLDEKSLRRATVRSGGFSLDRGLIICNPPYGIRIGEDDPDALRALYSDLQDWAFDFGPGWRAAFLVANPDFERMFPRRPKLKKPISTGQLNPYLLVYDLG